MRPRTPPAVNGDVARGRMAPNGLVKPYSQSMIPRPAIRKVRKVEQPLETIYPASLMGYNSASPPYKIWVMDWNNNLPTDLAGTGFIRMTLAADLADTTFALIVEGFTNGVTQYVTVTGGPFTSGQVVESPTFTVDMAGFDSSEADVLLPASIGFYTPYYDSVPRTTGDFQTSTADLVIPS